MPSSHTCTDAWIDKYIFPNGMIPSIAQLGKAMEGRWVVEDWQNSDRAWPSLQHKYSERFYRVWKYYLLGCAGGFRTPSCSFGK